MSASFDLACVSVSEVERRGLRAFLFAVEFLLNSHFDHAGVGVFDRCRCFESAGDRKYVLHVIRTGIRACDAFRLGDRNGVVSGNRRFSDDNVRSAEGQVYRLAAFKRSVYSDGNRSGTARTCGFAARIFVCDLERIFLGDNI